MSVSHLERRRATRVFLHLVLLGIVTALQSSVLLGQARDCALAVTGRIRILGDSATSALESTRVIATWIPTQARGQAVEQLRVEARTGRDGQFTLCGLPSGTPISLRALSPLGRSEVVRTLAPRGDSIPLVIGVDPALAPLATIVGAVFHVDSTSTRPAPNAEIAIPSLSLATRSDSSGAFRLTSIIPGRHSVIARQVGLSSVQEDVEFAPNDEIFWRVPLLRTASLGSMTITATRIDPALLEFEEHRRLGLGRFLSREDLAKLEGRRVGDVLRPMTGARVLGGGPYQYINSRRYVQPMRALEECRKEQSSPGSPIYVPSLADKRRGIQCTCYAHVYVDGQLMNPGTPAEPYDLSQLAVTGIESLEWYSSPAQLPFKYASLNSSCGVLVIHRRRPSG